MRFPYLILVFLFVLFLTGCSKDDPVIPVPEKEVQPDPKPEEPEGPQLETYFTFEAGPNSIVSPSTGDWIIIHKANGDLLDYKPIKNGETLTFQALDTVDTNEITVSLLIPLETEFNKNYIIRTYGKIEKGRTWNYDIKSSNSPQPTGQFNLTVSNIQNWLDYSLYSANGYGRFMDSYFHSLSTNDNDPNNLVLEDFFLYENNNYLLSIIDENRNPKYTWINNVQNNDQISIDGSSELRDFEQNVDLTLPEEATGFMYIASALADTAESSLQMYYVISPSDISGINSIRLGYLDDYQEFNTYLRYSFEDYSYSYSETGNGITTANIDPTKPTFAFSDTSHSNFSFETNADYVSYNSSWNTTSNDGTVFTSTVWNVSAQEGFFPRINEMPEEFTDLYPNLNIDDLKLINTDIHLKTSTWENYIGDLFGDKENIVLPSIKESMSFSPTN